MWLAVRKNKDWALKKWTASTFQWLKNGPENQEKTGFGEAS
jgi:hypothetical protein